MGGDIVLYNYPPPSGGGYKGSYMSHPEAVQRLKNIEGHIRGIQRMLDENAYCIDVIRQVQAVQAALSKVSSMILDEHLNTCLITAVRGEDPMERERVLHEIAEVFETATKT
jgi:DNA-binding FrmR family transcriptional regulator